MSITGQQVKDAVLAAGLTSIPHHACSICGCMTTYSISSGHIWYNPTCSCASYRSWLQPRTWQDAADWINMQENEMARTEIMQRFGLTVTQKD